MGNVSEGGTERVMEAVDNWLWKSLYLFIRKEPP